jgi:hypothetical protein
VLLRQPPLDSLLIYISLVTVVTFMDRIYKRFYLRLHTKLVGCVSFLVVDWIDGEFNMIRLDSRIHVKLRTPKALPTRFLNPSSRASRASRAPRP